MQMTMKYLNKLEALLSDQKAFDRDGVNTHTTVQDGTDLSA
jgi:hypothetical protein